MTSIESFIDDMSGVASPQDTFDLYAKAVGSFGFDRIVYSLITDHPSMGRPAGHGILGNYPDEWMRYYQEKGYRFVDPVPRRACADSRPFSWAELERSRPLSKQETLVMREAEEAGLLDGVGIPIYGPLGEIAGVGLASSEGGVRPDRSMLHRIRALTLHFHLVYGELHRRPAAPEALDEQVALTDREREILCWVAEGKSDSVIADIVGISAPGVRFHLGKIYRKLEVNERTLAVVKAIRRGLITPSVVKTSYQGR